ncbi:MAG: response regulator [Burkholderiales bacterium]|nr:response regulator [Burkholderiales bacterium]
MSSKPRSYSTTEVAKRLGISTQTVQRWVDSGQLKAWKTLGGHRRVEAEGAELLFTLHGKNLPDVAGDAPAPNTERPFPSILIVDDNPDDREILAHLLEDALPTASVAAATNGFHGLIAIGRMSPDVVITDLMMPHMNGFEMLKHLQSESTARPGVIVAVSSNTLGELASLGKLPPGVVFMQKPLEADEFIQMIQKAVEDLNGPRTEASA